MTISFLSYNKQRRTKSEELKGLEKTVNRCCTEMVYYDNTTCYWVPKSYESEELVIHYEDKLKELINKLQKWHDDIKTSELVYVNSNGIKNEFRSILGLIKCYLVKLISIKIQTTKPILNNSIVIGFSDDERITMYKLVCKFNNLKR